MNASGKQPMYQVQVTTADKQEVLVGPRVNRPQVLEPMVETINLALAAGKQSDWRDAHIVQVSNVMEASA